MNHSQGFIITTTIAILIIFVPVYIQVFSYIITYVLRGWQWQERTILRIFWTSLAIFGILTATWTGCILTSAVDYMVKCQAIADPEDPIPWLHLVEKRLPTPRQGASFYRCWIFGSVLRAIILGHKLWLLLLRFGSVIARHHRDEEDGGIEI